MFFKVADNGAQAQWLLAATAALFFLPWLGGMHLFDWDEINFAEAAREMLVTGDYLRVYIGFLPFWEKPPLFFWMQALAMHAFGVGEYAARLPNAVAGILSVVLLYRIGRHWHGSGRFGMLWALVYMGSVLPFFYHKSGIIDPWFNLFIFLGLHLLAKWRMNARAYSAEGYAQGGTYNKYVLAALAGLCTGLAVLTKGPAALLITGLVLVVITVINRFRLPISIVGGVLYLLVVLAVPGLWFGAEYLQNGPWFITEFTVYQWRLFSTPDAGHAGFPGYHFVVLLLGCFPASIFALWGMRKMNDLPEPQRVFRQMMLVLFWVVLLLFTYIKTKIVHYSSLCYLPLTYLAAVVIYRWWQAGRPLPSWTKGLLWGIGGLIAVLPTLFVLATTVLLPWVRSLMTADPFALANMDAEINWWGVEWLATPFYLAVLWWALRQFKALRFANGVAALFMGTATMTLLVLLLSLGRAESISQEANIEFFKSLRGQPAHVLTHGYKSYAQYYYTDAQPEYAQRVGSPTQQEEWKQELFYGPIDVPVFVSTKIHKAHELDSIPTLQRLYAKNGFVFYQRVPGQRPSPVRRP